MSKDNDHTKHVAYTPDDLPEDHPRRKLRDLSMKDFVAQFGSGTLKKSQLLGFDVQQAYLQERAKFEFGNGFEIIARSRIAYNDIELRPSQAMTELGWHAERMIQMRPFESDAFACKHMEVTYPDDCIVRGIGILVKATSASWLPKGHVVFAFVAKYKKDKLLMAENPF